VVFQHHGSGEGVDVIAARCEAFQSDGPSRGWAQCLRNGVFGRFKIRNHIDGVPALFSGGLGGAGRGQGERKAGAIVAQSQKQRRGHTGRADCQGFASQVGAPGGERCQAQAALRDCGIRPVGTGRRKGRLQLAGSGAICIEADHAVGDRIASLAESNKKCARFNRSRCSMRRLRDATSHSDLQGIGSLRQKRDTQA